MRKVQGVLMGIGIFALVGCGGATDSLDEVAQKQERKQKGYLETLSDVNSGAREDITAITQKRDQEIADALAELEGGVAADEKTVTKEVTTNNKKMNETNAPEQIDMSLAQTCAGAKITTNKGVIELKFFADKAPTAVANFCTLAQMNFYDDVIFHRVIKDFMIQGGDPTGTGTGGPGYQFNDELPAAGEYKLGSLAMANAGPNTNGSQFFIVSGDAGVGLPPLYTLFGEVAAGMDVVNAIQETETSFGDKPVEDVVIESVELIKK